MDLTPETLTPREQQLVEIELRRGRLLEGEIPEWRRTRGAELTPPMRKVLRAWQALPEDGRELLAHTLASRAGVHDPALIEVGAAIEEVIDMMEGRRVPKIAGLRGVVAALFDAWKERGRPTSIANLRRDLDEGRDPSDLHVFIAKHLIALFGRDVFSRSRYEEDVLKAACINADTALTGR